MKTYIQSRGKSQDHDHCWLEVLKDEEQRQSIPSELKGIHPENIIDSQKPSIILARSGNNLILLVTALQTGDGRTDFIGRQIRNSVVWIATEGGDKESLFRKLTIAALKGELDDAIDKAVYSEHSKPYGFGVISSELEEIKQKVDQEVDVFPEENSSSESKVGKDSEDLRDALIEELQGHTLLSSPNISQILVAVTTMKSEKGLKEQKVWRGLSSRGKSEDWTDEGWITYKPACCKDTGSKKKNQKRITLGVLSVIFLSGVIAVAVWIVAQHSTLQDPYPEQTIAPKEQTISSQRAGQSGRFSESGHSRSQAFRTQDGSAIGGLSSSNPSLPLYHSQYVKKIEYLLEMHEAKKKDPNGALSSEAEVVIEGAKDAIAHFQEILKEVEKPS